MCSSDLTALVTFPVVIVGTAVDGTLVDEEAIVVCGTKVVGAGDGRGDGTVLLCAIRVRTILSHP